MIKNRVQGCQAEEEIEVVERSLDCDNPRCGFAQIRGPDCRMGCLLGLNLKNLTQNGKILDMAILLSYSRIKS